MTLGQSFYTHWDGWLLFTCCRVLSIIFSLYLEDASGTLLQAKGSPDIGIAHPAQLRVLSVVLAYYVWRYIPHCIGANKQTTKSENKIITHICEKTQVEKDQEFDTRKKNLNLDFDNSFCLKTFLDK